MEDLTTQPNLLSNAPSTEVAQTNGVEEEPQTGLQANVPPPSYKNMYGPSYENMYGASKYLGLDDLKDNFVKDDNYVFESEKLNIYLDYWLGTLFVNLFLSEPSTSLDANNKTITSFVNYLLDKFYFPHVQPNPEANSNRKLVIDSFNKNFFNKISNKQMFDSMLSKLHISRSTTISPEEKNNLIEFICNNLLKSQLVRTFCLDCIIDQRSRTQKMRGMSKNATNNSKLNYFKFINKIKMFYFPYLNVLYEKDEADNFMERTEIPEGLNLLAFNELNTNLISSQASGIVNNFASNYLSSSQKVEHRTDELRGLSKTAANQGKRGARKVGKAIGKGAQIGADTVGAVAMMPLVGTAGFQSIGSRPTRGGGNDASNRDEGI